MYIFFFFRIAIFWGDRFLYGSLLDVMEWIGNGKSTKDGDSWNPQVKRANFSVEH